MPLTPEEEKRRRKAGDKDAIGFFKDKGGAKNSAFGGKSTTEAPGVSLSSKNKEKEKPGVTDYRGTTYKNRPDAESRPNLSKKEYRGRRQAQRDAANVKDFDQQKARDFAVGNLDNFNLRAYGGQGTADEGRARSGQGAARFSRTDAKQLLQHGRHTAGDLMKYAKGLDADGDKSTGFAGKGAKQFLQRQIEKQKGKTNYKATADIADRQAGIPRGTPDGLDPQLAKKAFQGRDFGQKDLKRYEDLYQQKYGKKPAKGTYEQGPKTGKGGGNQGGGSPNITGGGNTVEQKASTKNVVGGNTNNMNLTDSQNNNSGVITNDQSDNRVIFQEGSNTYNFGGNSGSGTSTNMSDLTTMQVAQGESMSDSAKYTTMMSATNNALQKQADKGFNPGAAAIAANKGLTQYSNNQLNNYITGSPQNMFDQADIELARAMGDQYKNDGLYMPDFLIKDKKKD